LESKDLLKEGIEICNACKDECEKYTQHIVVNGKEFEKRVFILKTINVNFQEI
jgi:hypothetical protein